MNWSQNYTVKSNARRAAGKAGVLASKVMAFVKAGKTLYHFPLPSAVKAEPPAAKAKAAKTNRPRKTDRPIGERGRLDKVSTLLRRPGGACITEIVAVTGWKPHSARARLSVDIPKLLGKGELIYRRREGGLSHYAIVHSKQLDLPIEEAA